MTSDSDTQVRADTIEVRYDAEGERFDALHDGEPIGAELHADVSSDFWDFRSVEVPKALEGRGIAGVLVRTALDHARSEGVKIKPSCPYVAAWLRRHPDQLELVHPRFRAGRSE